MFFGIFQREQKHKNKPYAQQLQTQDQVLRHCLFKLEQMRGQNIQKYMLFRAVTGSTGKWRGFSHRQLCVAQASVG